MHSTLLTVVIPVFNEAKQVEALAARTGALPCRVIIVDGSSADHTYEQLCRSVSANVRVMRSDRGRAKQMNAGASAVDSPFLLFLHADTILPGGWMTEVLETFHRGHLWGRFDVSFGNTSLLMRTVAWAMNFRSAMSGICTGDQAIFVVASVFRRCGGYAEIPLMEDIEICSRLKCMARPARLRSRVVTAPRRWELHGALTTIVKMWSLRLRYWFGEHPDTLGSRYTDVR